MRCWYCHNKSILGGEDWRRLTEVERMYRNSSADLITSAVVFTGGECTDQPLPLYRLIDFFREKYPDKKIGIHTNGMNWGVIKYLIDTNRVDFISLDIKTSWENYDELARCECSESVKESLKISAAAYHTGKLPELRLSHTMIRDEITEIVKNYAKKYAIPLKLQEMRGDYSSHT